MARWVQCVTLGMEETVLRQVLRLTLGKENDVAFLQSPARALTSYLFASLVHPLPGSSEVAISLLQGIDVRSRLGGQTRPGPVLVHSRSLVCLLSITGPHTCQSPVTAGKDLGSLCNPNSGSLMKGQFCVSQGQGNPEASGVTGSSHTWFVGRGWLLSGGLCMNLVYQA